MRTSRTDRHREDEPVWFSHPRLHVAAKKLRDAITLEGFYDHVHIGESEEALCEWLAKRARLPGREDLIERTLAEFRGERLNEASLFDLAVKFNAAKEEIRRGGWLPRWRSASPPFWAPVRVVEATPDSFGPGRPAVVMRVYVYAGPPAGRRYAQRISVKQARHFLRKIGVPKRDDCHPMELAGCVFSAWFTEVPPSDRIMIRMMEASPSNKDYNRGLHKGRNECEWTRLHFCDVCPKGADACPYAVRPKTLKKGWCDGGHLGYFERDPAPDETGRYYCVRCKARDRLMKWNKKRDD